MQRRPPALAIVLGALLSGASATSAAQAPPHELTSADVIAKVKAAGYVDVHGVAREGSHFDADAVKEGRPVHLHVDAKSGAISVAKESEQEEQEEKEESDKY